MVAGGDGRHVGVLSKGVTDIGLDDGGEWEIHAKKSKNKNGTGATRPWLSQKSNSRAWGPPESPQKQGMRTDGGSGRDLGNTWSARAADMRKPAGRGRAMPPAGNKVFEQGCVTSRPAIGAPLEHGWYCKVNLVLPRVILPMLKQRSVMMLR